MGFCLRCSAWLKKKSKTGWCDDCEERYQRYIEELRRREQEELRKKKEEFERLLSIGMSTKNKGSRNNNGKEKGETLGYFERLNKMLRDKYGDKYRLIREINRVDGKVKLERWQYNKFSELFSKSVKLGKVVVRVVETEVFELLRKYVRTGEEKYLEEVYCICGKKKRIVDGSIKNNGKRFKGNGKQVAVDSIGYYLEVDKYGEEVKKEIDYFVNKYVVSSNGSKFICKKTLKNIARYIGKKYKIEVWREMK